VRGNVKKGGLTPAIAQGCVMQDDRCDIPSGNVVPQSFEISGMRLKSEQRELRTRAKFQDTAHVSYIRATVNCPVAIRREPPENFRSHEIIDALQGDGAARRIVGIDLDLKAPWQPHHLLGLPPPHDAQHSPGNLGWTKQVLRLAESFHHFVLFRLASGEEIGLLLITAAPIINPSRIIAVKISAKCYRGAVNTLSAGSLP
jgi:hypothetical protein